MTNFEYDMLSKNGKTLSNINENSTINKIILVKLNINIIDNLKV